MLGDHDAAVAELDERAKDAKKMRRWTRVRRIAPWVAIVGLAIGLIASIVNPIANDDTEKAERAATQVLSLQHELERRDYARSQIEAELAQTKALLTATQARQDARIADLERQLRELGFEPQSPVTAPPPRATSQPVPQRSPAPRTTSQPPPPRRSPPPPSPTPQPTRRPGAVCQLLGPLC